MGEGGTGDQAAIVALLNLYGVAVDTQRWALFDRIFTAGVEADFGGASHWRDLAAFKRDFAAFHDPFDATQHAMMNHLVEVEGGEARSLCYGTWRLIRRGVPGGDAWFGTGWYDDAWVRAEDGWRIRHRVCRVAHWEGNLRVQQPDLGVVFELETVALRAETDAGRVGYLAAIEG
jgi:hypothetical protein